MSSPYHNPDIINKLIDLTCERAPELFEELDISYQEQGRRYVGICPCHESDNINSWNFYPDGEFVRGTWQCYTKGCHTKYNKGLVGLIRTLFEYREDISCSYYRAIDYLLSFNNLKNINEVKIEGQASLDKRKYQNIIKTLNNKVLESTSTLTREEFRKKVQIPAQYYIDRNYSPSVLDRYDVGLYNKGGRVLIPIYDDEYVKVVGYVARSIHEKCDRCGCYHKGVCPLTSFAKYQSAKWTNSKGFRSDSHLFNYWFAGKYIKKNKVVILTEGVGDVLRLEELGIHNSVGLFGMDLADRQRMIIDQSGAMSIIVMLDNDEGGIKGAERIKRMLGRSYRLFFPRILDDPGNLKEDKVTKDIRRLIKKLEC